MNILEKAALGLGLVVVGVTCVYRYVLSDEQRNAVTEVSDVVRSSVREVTDTVSPLVSDGPTKSEEEAMIAANRANTVAQWSELGY